MLLFSELWLLFLHLLPILCTYLFDKSFRSYGHLCVGADHKWKSIFRQCCATLGISGEPKTGDTQKAWDNVASILGSKHGTRHHELLQTIPRFGRTSLDLTSYKQITAYLQQVCLYTIKLYHELVISLMIINDY